MGKVLTAIYSLTMHFFLLPFVIVMEQGQLDEVTFAQSYQGGAHMSGERDHQCENHMLRGFPYCLSFNICTNVCEPQDESNMK